MKIVAVLILVFVYLCEGQSNDNSGKVNDGCSLASVTQNVGAIGEKVANMAEKITLLESKLQNAENSILELRSLTGGKPQVAFSAALRDSGSGNIGPFNTPTPLRYKRIFSNIGSNYNPSTGIFTALVKGVYFFRFSMFNNLNPTANSVVSLMKNGERLASVWDTSGPDGNDMGSNAVVIHLEVGDSVFVELGTNRVVYDDGMNYNTFSGFLLFTA
ncbi:complement C1q-like protein 2 [Antennarius striatus]|uniref:complement C1q-like protein 2 n=1 Tax=Antennarius striatus TaxID=241820 RepID=UPI0035B47842